MAFPKIIFVQKLLDKTLLRLMCNYNKFGVWYGLGGVDVTGVWEAVSSPDDDENAWPQW